MRKILVCFYFCFCFLAFASCLNKQNLDESSLGTPVNPDEIQGKMSDNIGMLDWYDVRKNEINAFTSFSLLEESKQTKLFRQDVYVTAVADTPEGRTIDFLFDRQDFGNAASSLSNQYFGIVVKPKSNKLTDLTAASFKSIEAQEEAPKPQPEFLFLDYLYYAVQGCRKEKMACYNLTTESSKMFIPRSKANPKICPNIEECRVDVNKIQFDRLDGSQLTSEGKPYRIHFTFLVSPQLPLLSKVIQYCMRGLVASGNRQILAEDCRSMDDFSYGQLD